MGAQHSKTEAVASISPDGPCRKLGNGVLKLKPPKTKSAAPTSKSKASATTTHDSGELELFFDLTPTVLRKFRINVPKSMGSGELMTIKLGGILTKVMITTPTSGDQEELQQLPTSYTSPVAASEDSSSSSGDSLGDSASSASAGLPSQAEYDHPNTTTTTVDPTVVVVASTDADVPPGKMIVTAKPVVVVHAVFPHQTPEKTQQCNIESAKQLMVERVMTEIIQETVKCGCNAVLGMTVSIKETHSHNHHHHHQTTNNGDGKDGGAAASSSQKYDAYLIKACGTPCYLMPTQVVLAAAGIAAATSCDMEEPLSSSEGEYYKMKPSTSLGQSRQRTSSVELSLRQAWSVPASKVVGRAT